MKALRIYKRGRGASVLVCVTALTVGIVMALMGASVASAAPKTSKNVGYVFDFGGGQNDTSYGGSSIFRAFMAAPTLGTYTTADSTKIVTVTDVPVKTIDETGVAALTPFDTLIVYEFCPIGEHPKTLEAINTFLTNGGKVMLFDADACAPLTSQTRGPADYSNFLFPFTTSSPGPIGSTEGKYTTVVPSTLTTGLVLGPQEGDSVGDANIFTSFSPPWCGSITATNLKGANGFVEAFARTASGGLVVYEGEDFWKTLVQPTHLRLVFDDVLKQNWAPDGLPCPIPTSGISISPPSQTRPLGSAATFTAKVVDANGNPVSGVNVTCNITTGPNAGHTFSGTTDSSGQTSFAYTSASPGTDVLVCHFVDSSGVTHTSNTATVTWVPPPPLPQIGSCARAGKIGNWTEKTCETQSPTKTGGFEWQSGCVKCSFTSKGSLILLRVPAAKQVIVCEKTLDTGRYTSPTTDLETVRFIGCRILDTKVKCTSKGAVEGEIVSAPLESELGLIAANAVSRVGLDLRVAAPGPLAEFACVHLTRIVGSLIGPITPFSTMAKTFKVTYREFGGVQEVTRFEGREEDTLSLEYPELEPGVLHPATLSQGLEKDVITNEEVLEINIL